MGRYLVLQLPTWLVIALLGWLVVSRDLLPAWVAIGGGVLWAGKDLALYPVYRRALSGEARAPRRLLGQHGTAVEGVQPEGYVRVAGELWRARVAFPEDSIPAGAEVRVMGVEGLTLRVARSDARTD
jgi:membrane protein implicated in regulation of membrane protease activity